MATGGSTSVYFFSLASAVSESLDPLGNVVDLRLASYLEDIRSSAFHGSQGDAEIV